MFAIGRKPPPVPPPLAGEEGHDQDRVELAKCGTSKQREQEGGRTQALICPQKEDPIARGRRGTAPLGMEPPLPAGGRRIGSQDVNTRIPPSRSPSGLRRSIPGAVVDYDDLEVGMILQEERLETVRDPGRLVARGQDHAEPGTALPLVGFRKNGASELSQACEDQAGERGPDQRGAQCGHPAPSIVAVGPFGLAFRAVPMLLYHRSRSPDEMDRHPDCSGPGRQFSCRVPEGSE